MTKSSGRTTIQDVAALAGVDRAVVSKVLANDPNLRVRDETRQRVIDATEKLNYRPHVFARRLATRTSGTIGLLVPDYRNPVYAEIIAGAESVTTERDLLLWTASTAAYVPDQYRALLDSGLMDALLVAGVGGDEQVQQLIATCPIPVLPLNRRIPPIDRWAILEDHRAAAIATRHLIEAGHGRIGFLGGPEHADTARRRLEGFRDAMQEAGLAADEGHIASADYTPAGGAEAIEVVVRHLDPPTAIVAANAVAALGAWSRLDELGVAVPADMSIVAIHRLPLEAFRVPPLTSVPLPLRRLGRRAAELVLDTPPTHPINETIVEDIAVAPGGTTASPRQRALTVRE